MFTRVGYHRGFDDGVASVEKRMADAAAKLSDKAHYQTMRSVGSVHPCPVEECVLSVEEHHRLAYGLIAENRELRRQVREGGKADV
jgi:hypothetical protein